MARLLGLQPLKIGETMMNIRMLQVGSLAVVLLASGCKTLDPYTGEEQTSKATMDSERFGNMKDP